MSIQTLDKLLICHIDCSIWSGRKKLRPEDFRLANGSQLPPKDVASLGSKKICDPEALANFERLKKEAQRLCEQVGVRFLGGYAVPEDRIDQIVPELDVMVNKFCRRSKRHFLVHGIFDVALNNPSLNGVDNNCKTECNFQPHR